MSYTAVVVKPSDDGDILLDPRSSFWGPYLWYIIHTFAYASPNTPQTKDDIENYIAFYNSLYIILPDGISIRTFNEANRKYNVREYYDPDSARNKYLNTELIDGLVDNVILEHYLATGEKWTINQAREQISLVGNPKMDMKIELKNWAFLLHNEINIMLGKTVVTYTEIDGLYNKKKSTYNQRVYLSFLDYVMYIFKYERMNLASTTKTTNDKGDTISRHNPAFLKDFLLKFSKVHPIFQMRDALVPVVQQVIKNKSINTMEEFRTWYKETYRQVYVQAHNAYIDSLGNYPDYYKITDCNFPIKARLTKVFT